MSGKHKIQLFGPSGDGAHIEIDGQYYAYGNTVENAYKNAIQRALSQRDAALASEKVN